MSLDDEQIEQVSEILSPVGEMCETLISQLNDFDLESALETINKIEKTIHL